MRPIESGQLIENLQWRYATKKFDATRKIAEATWRAIEQTFVLAPSSFGLQPWKFFVITSPAVRQELRPHAWNQPQITDASHLVVLARKATVTPADVERYVQRIADVRGVPLAALNDYKNMMLGYVTNPPPGFSMEAWTSRQAYIALGFSLASAAQLGVDACPMEGFIAPKFDEILGLPAQGYHSTVVAAFGYRAADDPFAAMKKVRFPLESMVEHR